MNFYKPKTLEEAVSLLETEGNIVLAGGTDLVVKLRNGLMPQVTGLVDILDLPLNRIEIIHKTVRIGSCCTLTQVINDPIIKENFPALVSAVSTIGAQQIKNASTIGGNSGNASPAGDSIPALMSLDARVVVFGRAKSSNTEAKERIIDINDFFKAPGKTALEKGEFIKAFELPLNKTSGCFLKLGERRAHAIAKINLALSSWQENGQQKFRIALGSVGPTVIRCPEAEELLGKSGINSDSIKKASEMASNSAQPISDVRSSFAYRKKMAGVLLERALGLIGRQQPG